LDYNKLRECISKQERISYNKPDVNNEKQIRIKFNKEINREITYNYLLYKKEKRMQTFFEIFNCNIELVRIEEDKIIVRSILKLE